MIKPLLAPEHDQLLDDNRQALSDLERFLERVEGTDEDRRLLAESVRRLDELFLLVVAGEFNAGKSAFINALVGQRLLKEGVTPTTARIHLLGHGEAGGEPVIEDGVARVSAPLELLRHLHIVDTPGTNAIDREHEAITRRFVPASDLVLFVTSADRPFTESERAFLEGIREWGKKVVVVVNKIDHLAKAEDIAEIETFIADSARRLLGFEPAVFPVSALQALEAKLAGDAVPESSRFEALERYIVETLDAGERLRLKLLNPLGVGRKLATTYRASVDGQMDLLRGDFTALEDIEGQLEVYREDMTREFRFRLADVEKVLHAFENRGHEFFDETLRLTRAFDLMNRSKIQADFERQVVADVPQQIDHKVSEIIDWMINGELRQWEAVRDRLAARQAAHQDRIVGGTQARFELDRGGLLEAVGGAARRTVDSFDRRRESARLAESVQSALASTALLEAGAVGLGTLVATLATSTAVDITGILAASTLAVVGLFVIPAKRKRAKADLKVKIEDLRHRLVTTLTEEFEGEIDRSIRRVLESIAPYSRFVRAERDKLTALTTEAQRLDTSLADLAERVQAIS
ncbi:MAG: dynamin family protein [Acidobacteriota bacterium]